MCFVRNCVVTILVVFSLLLATETLASIGKVVGVRPGATLSSGGKSEKIRANMEVNSGDTISTNASGIVQLIFSDGTKIAVGPNSRMEVKASMLRGNQRAKNFAVKALGGSFRFISGNSDSGAYKIKTPNATMGIRGTLFDFWVDGQKQTALVILKGEVRMCKPGGRCFLISGRCALVIADKKDKISAAASKEQASLVIQSGFPFIRSQGSLQETFRTSTIGCSQSVQNASHFSQTSQTKAPKSEPPEPEPPEPEPPEPEPPAPGGTGFPGRSGDQGPSRGKGNDVSNGQLGTGTGKGQGFANRAGEGGASGQGGSTGNTSGQAGVSADIGGSSDSNDGSQGGASGQGGETGQSGGNSQGGGNGNAGGNGNGNGNGNAGGNGNGNGNSDH